MFRKVQLKFFGIITAILIAIFIGVLSSINIIMDVIMERQTKVVLQQVASGVEYNNKTETFSFKNPNKQKEEPRKSNKPPVTKAPIQTTTQTETTTTIVNITEAKSVETSMVTTTVPPQTATEDPIEIPVTEAPTEPPTELPRTELVKPTEPPPVEKPPHNEGGNNGGGENQPPPQEQPTEPNQWENPWGNPWENPWANPWENPWGNPWGNPWANPWYNWGNNGDQWNWDGQNQNNAQQQSSWGGINPVANTMFVPVLNEYTISVTNTKPKFTENSPPRPTDPQTADDFVEPVPKSLGSIEFFVIMADNDGKFTASANNDGMSVELAQEYINEIIKDNNTIGMTRNHSYCAEKKPNGTLMVLTDRTAEIEMMRKLKRITIIVGIISIIFLSVAAYFLSGLIVQPLKDTFEKQKQFISDASHELKTPLTVISTNADVLSGEIGNNKWLNYIHDQTDRMNVLVNDLLNLSRLENSNRDFITSEFDLSRAVTNAALPFECQAFESKKNFVLNIEEGIRITGSEQHIKQMTGIFIDNALKYSKDGGTVRVSLTKEENKAVLVVYNTGSGVPEEDVDKLFERFYRSDESRARTTGGYGLGLAIAKSIIDKHKFKIQVENQEGRSISFVVTMQ